MFMYGTEGSICDCACNCECDCGSECDVPSTCSSVCVAAIFFLPSFSPCPSFLFPPLSSQRQYRPTRSTATFAPASILRPMMQSPSRNTYAVPATNKNLVTQVNADVDEAVGSKKTVPFLFLSCMLIPELACVCGSVWKVPRVRKRLEGAWGVSHVWFGRGRGRGMYILPASSSILRLMVSLRVSVIGIFAVE
jgi:hypothetical protein